MLTYAEFLYGKTHSAKPSGLRLASHAHFLYDFQAALVEWALELGRAAIFADCGLGKTPMQLSWAQNIVEHENRSVLVLTPLAVGSQTVEEGRKFGIPCLRSRDGRVPETASIVVTNYEKLHLFNPHDFVGIVCDESSILKHFSGATQKQVTRFAAKLPYRLLCTATAAPNDYIELGTSSEALGELGYSDMLSMFFKQDDNKPHRRQEIKDWRKSQTEVAREKAHHFARLSFRASQSIGQWRLKGHAVTPFWRWVASWARACRKPSDLGFSDERFILPSLIERDHLVTPRVPKPGQLFVIPAKGLQEEREERRRSLTERCEKVAELVADDTSAVVWCHLNVEGDLLAKMLPTFVQVKGADSDEAKEEAYRAFASGQVSGLITKPKIGAWGLNWQHCHHVVTFASHSYEQYYQSVRRCWRYGQAHPVIVDVIATEGEQSIRDNMHRKARAADEMFSELVMHMHSGERQRESTRVQPVIEVPSWL